VSGPNWFSRATLTVLVVVVVLLMFPVMLLLKVSEAVALAWVFVSDCMWQLWWNKGEKVANAKAKA
jgi:hypothetical protein